MSEMIPEGHPLEGVRLKLDRAEQHLNMLNSQIGDFFQRAPYFVSYERKPDGSEHIFRIHSKETPPLAFGLLIGDCLQNMRTALDHLAWQLAILSGKSSPDTRTAFPICATKEAFEGGRTKPKLKDLSAEYRAVIKRLQPFRIGREARDHWLWHLNELARIDRHRVLHIVGGIQSEADLSAQTRDRDNNPVVYPLGELGQTHTIDMSISYAPFKDGAEIARFGLSPPNTEVEMNYEPTFIVAFGEDVGIGPHHDINSILGNILYLLRTEVVPPFVDFF